VIAARAGISTAAARQALLAHEKAGTATRVKGSRPGIADTWTPAVPAAPAGEAPPAETPGAGSIADAGQPAAEPADAGQPAPVTPDGTAEGQQAEARTEPGPDPAVTAEAAGTVAAIAQAADEAGKALAAGNLDVALAALEAARDLAAQGRRAVKAAASGRRAPATRPGALRDLVEEHLRKFPETAFTPHQVGQAGQPRHRRDGHRQAPHLPARPRPGGRPRPGRGRRSRRQRGDGGQRRVTRPAWTARPGRQRMPPRPRRLPVYRTCTQVVPAPGRPAVPPGAGFARTAGLPRPVGYIRALTCAGISQVYGRSMKGPSRELSCPASRAPPPAPTAGARRASYCLKPTPQAVASSPALSSLPGGTTVRPSKKAPPCCGRAGGRNWPSSGCRPRWPRSAPG
jgi:hypothetical protein